MKISGGAGGELEGGVSMKVSPVLYAFVTIAGTQALFQGNAILVSADNQAHPPVGKFHFPLPLKKVVVRHGAVAGLEELQVGRRKVLDTPVGASATQPDAIG